MAGHLASLLLWRPPCADGTFAWSPLRPWKAEQLGGGYRISSWVEQTAVKRPPTAVIARQLRHGAKTLLRVYPTVDPNRVHVVRNGN